MARSRVVSIPIYIGELANTTPPSSQSLYNTIASESSTLLLGDRGHYGYPDFPADRNVGGLFSCSTYKWWANTVNVGKIWRGGPSGSSYEGLMVPYPPSLGAAVPTTWTPTGTIGSGAYNRMKPTKPSFAGLNAAYELRELPRMLRQRMTNNSLKNIGSYHLALEFGWKPLLKDIRNLVLTQMEAQKRLVQLLRDNGKPVRRRVTLLDTATETVITDLAYNAFQQTFVTQFYRQQPMYMQRLTTSETIWASARFRYWLPGGPQSIAWRRKMLARIFGLKPSPKVVWDALPWTWLIDWFTDIGSMLDSMDAGVADRLAADYYYIMYKKQIKGFREATCYFKRQDGTPVNFTANSFGINSYQSRSVGDPFGWNTPLNNLSGMQLSILGALGLSRLR